MSRPVAVPVSRGCDPEMLRTRRPTFCEDAVTGTKLLTNGILGPSGNRWATELPALLSDTVQARHDPVLNDLSFLLNEHGRSAGKLVYLIGGRSKPAMIFLSWSLCEGSPTSPMTFWRLAD